MGVPEKIRAFVTKEAVLVISVIAALLSCAAVPPDLGYASYIDWHTLALLFALMIVVAGLRFLGVMRIMGEWVVSRMRSRSALAFALVALVFLSSMFITNDVALITFVPFAIVIMHRASMDASMGAVVALMTIAANLGSMMLPMGNPQNLYLFQASQMSVADFVALMAPYTIFAALLLTLSLVVLFGRRRARRKDRNKITVTHPRSSGSFRRGASKAKCAHAGVYGFMFLVCLCAVIGVFDGYLVCLIVVLIAFIMDAAVLKRVDYGLLFTFVALFVFVGNVGRMPLVHDAVSGFVGSVPVLASVLSSQVISNVPAALLLSGFTDQWQALIVGTNIGGLGTLIASMASVISFKLITTEGLVKRRAYLLTFIWYNVAFLILMLLFHVAFTSIVP